MTGGVGNVRKGKATQRAVAEFYRKIGRCIVYENSDPGQPKGKSGHRGAPGRTPGMPDMIVYPPMGVAFWHEAKAGSGRLTPAQVEHQRVSESRGLHVVVGDLEAAATTLTGRGLIRKVDGVWEYIGPRESR